VTALASRVARFVSPKHRAWARTLESCRLDPDDLIHPVAQPASRDFIICGHSRSGTSLVSAALWQPPRLVVAMEPWDCFRLGPAELFTSLRRELDDGVLSRTRLDVEQLTEHRSVAWQPDGSKSVPVELQPNFLLGVKMPIYWRYLELLPDTKFIVCLRDPVEVITSYGRVGGRLADGQDYAIPFNRRMNAELSSITNDRLRRRIAMFDYVSERIIPHLGRTNVCVVRYEAWGDGTDTQTEQIAQFLDVELDPATIDITLNSSPAPPPDELATILQHCSSAGRLGYDLSRWRDLIA
jgi:hypothetical protein